MHAHCTNACCFHCIAQHVAISFVLLHVAVAGSHQEAERYNSQPMIHAMPILSARERLLCCCLYARCLKMSREQVCCPAPSKGALPGMSSGCSASSLPPSRPLVQSLPPLPPLTTVQVLWRASLDPSQRWDPSLAGWQAGRQTRMQGNAAAYGRASGGMECDEVRVGKKRRWNAMRMTRTVPTRA